MIGLLVLIIGGYFKYFYMTPEARKFVHDVEAGFSNDPNRFVYVKDVTDFSWDEVCLIGADVLFAPPERFEDIDLAGHAPNFVFVKNGEVTKVLIVKAKGFAWPEGMVGTTIALDGEELFFGSYSRPHCISENEAVFVVEPSRGKGVAIIRREIVDD